MMISQSILTLLLAIALFGIPVLAKAAELEGRVVGVSDGDTITVLVGEHDSVKVRLAGIDAPEKAQPFGSVSKRIYRTMCTRKKLPLSGKRKIDTVEFSVECWSMEPMCAWSRFVQDWRGITNSMLKINRQF